MFITDLFVALAFGFIIVWIIYFIFGTKGPWNSFLWFLLVVSLFSWAGGIWLVPFGPAWHGTNWLPIILMGILISLVLVAATPKAFRKRITGEEKVVVEAERAIFDGLIWILIASLLILAFGRYTWFPRIH